MDKSDITRLCQQAENEYSAFLNELQKLEVLEYPTKACLDLIRELKAEAKGHLEKIQEKARIAVKSPELLGNIKLEVHDVKVIRKKLVGNVDNLTLYLDWISGAQTRKVPWSFIPSAENLAKTIIPERKVVLYCENQYNYRIVWCKDPTKGFRQYCFVSLPRLHRTNILMHVWIGHELFHPLCKKFTEKRERKVGENIAKMVRDTLRDLPYEKLSRQHDILMVAWERALQELLCDIALGKIFGPAGLLAMRAFASFSEWKGRLGPETNFYPPWQYRFETVWQKAIDRKALQILMSKAQESASMGKAGKSFCDSVNEFGKTLDSNRGFQYVMQDKLYKIAYAEVNNLLPDAAEFVSKELPENLPKWNDSNALEQVPKLVGRLQAHLPPNEIPNYTYDSKKKKKGAYAPQPAQVPALLTAGWIYQCHRQKVLGQKEKDILDYAVLSRLLLKACEDSEMLRNRT